MTNIENKQTFDIRRFKTATFLCMTIGIPFCVFKILFGILCIRTDQPQLFWFGTIILIWASTDLLLNLLHIIFSFFKINFKLRFCLISQIGVYFNRPSLFLAIDTFISFLIICFVLWSGWIARLKGIESWLWIGATTVNLLSLSLSAVWIEIKVNSDKNEVE